MIDPNDQDVQEYVRLSVEHHELSERQREISHQWQGVLDRLKVTYDLTEEDEPRSYRLILELCDLVDRAIGGK